MTRAETRSQLETLLELLQQERDRAQCLDMEGLRAVVAAKEAIIAELKPEPEEVAEFQDLLKRIDHENRRNAFLLWTGLNWVRDMMGFFGQAAMPQVYGGTGQARTVAQGGRLLSGKV